ncbi:general stress protein [Paenibacillus sp. IB182496]|uniref:General stress protein n=2 Tax=Paenibacillus sabuli TaxID=2772509 RepID=A0A927BYH1_9BACL|nr:general stress protein [Paenibacillus sabuli]MBD2847819.1 general stress protein [Paenibacillus sabuli]
MNPIYKPFSNDEEIVNAVQSLQSKGVDEDDIYVIAHDKDRTKRVADNADANTVGMKEQGMDTQVKNVFRSTGDKLRAQFKELGFSEPMAEELEEKLDKGQVILVVKDARPGLAI